MKILMISHGDLAKAMLGSAQMIVGEQEDIQAFGLYPEDDIVGLKTTIEEAVKEMGGGEDIICFTDLFNGSPFNAVVNLMGTYPIYHITGMNLPMILEALMTRLNGEVTREALAEKLMAQAPDTFIDVNRFLVENLD